MRQPIALALAIVALSVAAPVFAQSVYKWKDAKGVTHYSETPPAKGKFTALNGVSDPNAAAAATPAQGSQGTQAAAPANDSRCTNARDNLAKLQSKVPVQIDNDNDGKPDQTLGEADRNSQIELARSTLKAYNCTETTPPAA